jgi:hypothetical protein
LSCFCKEGIEETWVLIAPEGTHKREGREEGQEGKKGEGVVCAEEEKGNLGQEEGKEILASAEGFSKAHDEGFFVCGAVLFDVADIIDSKDCHGEGAWRDAGEEGFFTEESCLQTGGDEDRSWAIEEENEDVAGPKIGQREWSGCVEDAKGDIESKQHTDHHASFPHKIAATEGCKEKGGPDRPFHRRRSDKATLGDTHKSFAVCCVSPFDKIEVVIDEVGADLDRQSGEQSEQEKDPIKHPLVHRNCCPDEGRANAGDEGFGACGVCPHLDPIHGVIL